MRQVSGPSTSSFRSLLVLLQACLCAGVSEEPDELETGVEIDWPWELGVVTLLIVLSTLFLWETCRPPCRRGVTEHPAQVRAVSLDKKSRRAKKLQERIAAAIDSAVTESAVSESPLSEEPMPSVRKGRNKCPTGGTGNSLNPEGDIHPLPQQVPSTCMPNRQLSLPDLLNILGFRVRQRGRDLAYESS